MDIKELKAKAYDLIAGIEAAQAQLRKINKSIAEELKKQEEK